MVPSLARRSTSSRSPIPFGRRLRGTALAALVLAALPGTGLAGGTEPGSFLIFPEYDNRPGQMTYLTITNVHTTSSIRVHMNYVDSQTCLTTNRFATLTPRDTLTFLTSFHVPGAHRGYMWCYATSTTNGAAIDFDHLIGAALRVDGIAAYDASLPPLTLQGVPGAGLPTDVDMDGRRDLDGVEYERAPRTIYVPRFFGQGQQRMLVESELVLFQILGGPDVTTNTSLLVYNDNEETFSGQFAFDCWTRVPLASVSGVFAASFLAATNHDPDEVEGSPTTEAGWFRVRGTTYTGPGGTQANPQIFGFLAERRPYSAADLPYVEDV
jgi:hypothetical protein